MLIGFSTSIFVMLFLHAKEATAIGLSQALFGKATLAGFPWTFVDPIVIALPISAITLTL